MALLEIQGLTVQFKTRAGVVHAVDDVSLSLSSREILGVAGESGCGKTTTMLSIPRLLPKNATVLQGKILFEGNNLLDKTESEMEKIRWRDISMIFQGSMNAFNPVHTIVAQIREPITHHEPGMNNSEIAERTQQLLEMVGISNTRARNYPHEFSGGMRQRAMIAMALACNPKLVIADEPVTALDVMIQAQILNLIKELSIKFGLSMILISHDLSVIAETCQRVAIMYAGRVVEQGTVEAVFNQPAHPYSRGLLSSFPDIFGRREFVMGIPGYPPDLIHPPQGCCFYERCPARLEQCAQNQPPMTTRAAGHSVACHLYEEDQV